MHLIFKQKWFVHLYEIVLFFLFECILTWRIFVCDRYFKTSKINIVNKT